MPGRGVALSTHFPRAAWTGLAIPWVGLLWHLAEHWSSNAQYSYGWLVPLLAGILFYREWKSRPHSKPCTSRLPLYIVILSAILCGPLWLIAQANPGWRALSWCFSLTVIALSLAVVFMVGGRPWLGRFAFPFALILTAVPWPSEAEAYVTQGLMRMVTGATVDVLNALGIVAVANGNVIETASGMLGVDEACSGIRSLQGSLMVSIFLGEFVRLTFSRRIVLIAATVAVAFLGNVIRSTLLGLVTSRSGEPALERWHDPAGFTILTLCILFSAVLAFRLAEKQPLRSHVSFPSGSIPNPFPRWLPVTLTAWWIMVFAFTEYWYGVSPNSEPTRWHFRPPGNAGQLRSLEIPPAAAGMLRYDSHDARAWRDSAGHSWLAYYFKWDAGPARSRLLARIHTPETCLAALGLAVDSSKGQRVFSADGAPMNFRLYSFKTREETGYVFYAAWEQTGDEISSADLEGASVMKASLDAVWNRRRNLAQQVLEVIVLGCDSPEDAETAFRGTLPLMLSYRGSR